MSLARCQGEAGFGRVSACEIVAVDKMAPDRAWGYLRGVKSTLVMLGTVAVVVILIASAVLVWTDHHSRPYLIGMAVAGGATLAYAGWKWKRDTKGS